jgi:hypothetical protein
MFHSDDRLSITECNHDSLKAISFKSETGTGDDNRLERRLYYSAYVGRPSFERQKEVNREQDEGKAA